MCSYQILLDEIVSIITLLFYYTHNVANSNHPILAQNYKSLKNRVVLLLDSLCFCFPILCLLKRRSIDEKGESFPKNGNIMKKKNENSCIIDLPLVVLPITKLFGLYMKKDPPLAGMTSE